MLLGGLTSAKVALGQVTLTQTAPLKAKATLELSSSSIQRGKTLIDGPTVHPSVWAFTSFGLGVGAWAAAPLENRDGTNPVFYEQKQGEFVKVDSYLAYKFPQTEFVTVDMILAQYYFPQDNLLKNPTMRDFIAKIAGPFLFNPFVSVAYGLSSAIKRDYYIEAGVQETLLQRERHSLSFNALSTYRKPDEESATKQEGIGHSHLGLAYNYGGIRLAGSYIFKGKDEVVEVNEDTQYNTAVSYTAWF
jgi:hypothetical protein